MKQTKRFILSFLLLAACTIMYAQEITGTVTDAMGPVIGATVMEKGTNNGTVTDFDGNFKLKVAAGKTLVFSYIGYDAVEAPAKDGMAVTMKENAKELAEVVVTGYQVQRKADLTGAVGVMDLKKAKSEGSNNIVNSLQGRIPGVNVITDPAPGGGSSSIQIRGVSNFNGNNAPLYVIDGVATTENLNSINPADIETMQVLKDASSASIYGSRAANGVIIITTKSGKGGKLSVNVGYTANAQFVAKKIDMLNANQFGTLYYQAMANNNQSGYNPNYTYDSAGNAYLNQYVAGHEGEVGYELHDTNWQDQMYSTAWTHNLNASVSSSSEKGSVMFSGNYITQNGIAKYSKYKRYTIRLNSTYNISKYVTVGENLMVARWNNNIGGFGGDAGVAGNTLRQFAGMPVTQSDGSYSVGKLISGSDTSNPMEDLYNARENDSESWRIFGNGYIEVKPIKGLSLKSNIGYDHLQFENDNLNRTTYANSIASVFRAFGKGDTWTWTNTANYLGLFGRHTINGLVGVEAIGYDYSDFNATRKNYLNENYNYMVIGAGTGEQSNGGGKASWGLFSLFGKVDYNYADRYLFSVTLRYDKTSRLGKSNNSGTFPAFSGAWRITEEKFWKKNSILTDMKLRLAWGQNGNSAIGDYATYTTYSTSNIAGYDLDGTGTKFNEGLAVSNRGTEGLKWETTSQFNVGLDTRWMNGAIGFSSDFYVKSTKDMLTQPPVISAEGPNALQWRNTGNMRNVGIEATLDYRSPMYGDFSWDGSVNIAHYKNKVTQLNDAQTYIGEDIRLIKDQPMGVYYGYVCDGIFQTKEQVANHATQPGAEPGRLIFRDINGDGKITDDDRCIIGDPNPDLSLSLNLDLKWKNFTLSTFFTGEFGFDVVNSMKHLTDFFSYGNALNNRGTSTLGAWTPTNTGASVPAVSVVDNNNESRFSTYYIEDGSYFKMKYVKISYDVPASFCRKLYMNSINVFAQLENVFTITKYKGLDPELGTSTYGARIDNGPYPRSRTFSMGINVSL